jgi:osmotically-inducible protein OsmY
MLLTPRLPILVAGLALPVVLSGCVGVAVTGGATAATAAAQERGFKGTVDDTIVRARINDLWLQHSAEIFQNVGLQVTEGRVLLTGKLKDPQLRLDAVKLAWQAQGVNEVINEIQVTEEGSIGSYARDTAISTELKSRLLFDKQVSSINYSIETVGQIIYVMGIAQDQAELDRVINHARNIAYVRRVVSYVRLKDDPSRKRS